ncbi:hypothetical protein ASZ90_019103 [hydrocarbon metagenome]|uniref:Uncharacterized protein n=1 Tax=hydrocarbon metagenome TaxID=938273 RepID=A0A0W8E4B0_9ZZZZ
MNYRRILYIAFIVFIALFFFRTLENDDTIDNQVQYMTKDCLLDSIGADSEINQDTSTIFFPRDYRGESGEVFYISSENDNGYITYKYRIEEIEAGTVKELQYKLEQTWEGIKIPEDKFDAYRMEDGQWVEI